MKKRASACMDLRYPCQNRAAEVLERYCRSRLSAAPGRIGALPLRRRRRGGRRCSRPPQRSGRHGNTYRRVLGEEGPGRRGTFTGREDEVDGQQDAAAPGCRTIRPKTGSRDMDGRGGRMSNFLIPDILAQALGRPARIPALEIGMMRAYHRHMADFLRTVPQSPQEHDRRLDPQCRRGGARDPRMGEIRNGR